MSNKHKQSSLQIVAIFILFLCFLQPALAHKKNKTSNGNNQKSSSSSGGGGSAGGSGDVQVGVSLKGSFSQVIAFGDSYTDTGNCMFMSGLRRFFGGILANSPYGSIFKSPKNGNRFCDGKLVVDFLCEALGIPHLPPYKDPQVNVTYGVNFAVSGSTSLTSDLFSKYRIGQGLLWKSMVTQNFLTQLDWFEEFVQKMAAAGGGGGGTGSQRGSGQIGGGGAGGISGGGAGAGGISGGGAGAGAGGISGGGAGAGGISGGGAGSISGGGAGAGGIGGGGGGFGGGGGAGGIGGGSGGGFGGGGGAGGIGGGSGGGFGGASGAGGIGGGSGGGFGGGGGAGGISGGSGGGFGGGGGGGGGGAGGIGGGIIGGSAAGSGQAGGGASGVGSASGSGQVGGGASGGSSASGGGSTTDSGQIGGSGQAGGGASGSGQAGGGATGSGVVGGGGIISGNGIAGGSGSGQASASSGINFGQVLVWIGEMGVNDYARMISSSILTGNWLSQISVNHVTKILSAVLEKGAKYIVVQGLPPVGCLPLTLSHVPDADRDEHGCSATINALVKFHNQLLQKKITEIQGQHKDCVISYADYYSAYITIMTNVSTYQVQEPLKACCGASTGLFNFSPKQLCGAGSTGKCSDPSKYIVWDGLHLTEAMHSHLAELFFNKGYCHPSLSEMVAQRNKCA